MNSRKIAMVTIKEIEQTVSSLASEELTTLYAWFEEYDGFIRIQNT